MFNPLENKNKLTRWGLLILFLCVTVGMIAFFFLTGFENFDFSKILNIERIFQGSPGSSFQYYEEFAIFFGLLLIVGIILKIVLIFEKNKAKRNLFKKIKNLTLSVSVLGFLYLFFRSEKVDFFSSRFFLIIILLLFIAWAFFIIFYVLKKYPYEMERYQKKEMIKKYLPKQKKKK